MKLNEIIDIKKLSLIEASILVRLYNVYPERLSIFELLGDASYIQEYVGACEALVDKGYVVKVDGGYGFVWG